MMALVTAPAGRRERKKLATRAALRRAALRLALRDGVENVTAERIADEADIALRTFFNYFSSKEEAVVAAGSTTFHAFLDEIRARPHHETVLEAVGSAALVVMDQTASGDSLTVLRLIRREPWRASARPTPDIVLNRQTIERH